MPFEYRSIENTLMRANYIKLEIQNMILLNNYLIFLHVVWDRSDKVVLRYKF